ncbi:unnamed protein product, partial [Prorocentrum cordatum]
DTFEIVAVNGSGWGTIAQLWQEEVAGAGFAESHRADARFVQETHLHARDISAQEARCRRAAVKAALAPGAAGSGGAGGARAASGGPGVAAPAARGLANASAAGGGRVTCSDGRGVVAVTGAGGPRVIGGDFDAAPDVFKAKAGWWLEAAQGAIAQSAEGETCFQRPRCAVKLALNARVEIAPMRVLRQPGACPRELPIASPTSDHLQISGGPTSSGQAWRLLAVADCLGDAAMQRRARRRVPAWAAKCCGARWVAAMAAVAVATADALAALASEARVEAAAPAAERSRRRHERFSKWVLDALEHGAGGRRAPRGWLEDELDMLGGPRAGQREVDAVDGYWAREVWSLDDGLDGRRDFERQTDSEALPGPTAAEWLDAAKSFAKRTGTGVDCVSPRAFAQVSEATAEIFVDIGAAAEEWGGRPLAARASLIVMLPEPAGGWRPIGLLSSALRIWNKLEIQAALKAGALGAKPTKATKNPGVDFCLDGSAAAGAARKRRARAREQLGRVASRWPPRPGAATWRSQAERALLAWGRGLARNRPDATCDVLRARRHAAQVRLEQGPGALAGHTATHRRAMDSGATLKLEEIGSHALCRRIRDSHQRRLWREAVARDADLERAASSAATRGLRRRLLGAKATPEQRARWSSARNAALGGLWPVARRAALGPPLRRSGARPAGCGGRGAARHLAWRRPALAAERRYAIAGDEAPRAFADVAEASDSEDPRYSRALIPEQTAALPPPLETEEARWSSCGYAALAGANVPCTGGSAMRGKAGSPEACAGWGLATLQARGEPRGAGGVLEIGTDCKLLVTGTAAGKVRRDFRRAVGSFGGQQRARVTEEKGHATLRSATDGHTRTDDYEGDRAADSIARKGAELHPMNEAAMERIGLADAIAAATARWLGEALQLGRTALAAADGADAGAAESTCRGRSCGRRGAARCSDGGPGCRRGTAVSGANGTRWLCDACAGRSD